MEKENEKDQMQNLQAQVYTLQQIARNLELKVGSQAGYIAQLEVEKDSLIQLVKQLQSGEEETNEKKGKEKKIKGGK